MYYERTRKIDIDEPVNVRKLFDSVFRRISSSLDYWRMTKSEQ